MNQLEISEVVASTHLKSPLDLALEESVKRANKLDQDIKTAKADGKDVTGKELAFKIKENANLNNMAALQGRLDTYRDKANKMNQNEKDTESYKSNNSTILGLHLTAAGKFKPSSYWEAHHLICTKHPSHAASRAILFADKMKYAINDPDNGCWLPKKHKHALNTQFKKAVGHQYIHTLEYARWINLIVSGPGIQTKTDLKMQLKIIELKLISATTALNKNILTPKGQEDLRFSI